MLATVLAVASGARPRRPVGFDPTKPSQEHGLHLVDTFSLRNACIVYTNKEPAGEFVSRDGEMAMLHGFNEFVYGFRRLAAVRPETAADRAMISIESAERESR